MRSFITLSILVTSALATLNVTDISQCPPLTSRDTPATNVRDLRIDDIKVVGALGDSITAGYAIMNYNTEIPSFIAALHSYNEYRGLSYSIGGNVNASTVPNYIKHFQPNVTGYSIGKHLGEYCNADDCPANYRPMKDRLNAALSGSIAQNLDTQVSYLFDTFNTINSKDFQTDWKMINIQIGSNDMCGACNGSYMDEVTPEKYGAYVDSAIARIKAHVPNVLVNLIGTFNVSQVFTLTASDAGMAYCRPQVQNKTSGSDENECSCSKTPEGLAKMDELSAAYNEKLYDIYQKYNNQSTSNFTVVYQQSNINITGFPVDFFSDIDCFHPGLKGHEWVSKIIWNQLFVPQSLKPTVFNFDANQTLYCPTDSDRITTD